MSVELSEDQQKEIMSRLLVAARKWHAPAGVPTTANNLELLIMNMGWFTQTRSEIFEDYIEDLNDRTYWEDKINERDDLPEELLSVNRKARVILDALESLVAKHAGNPELQEHAETWRLAFYGFAFEWPNSTFAKVEVSHKLAAAFCLTDTPEEKTVKAPWEYWSLIIPNGLIPPRKDNPDKGVPARVWCLNSAPMAVVNTDGSVTPYYAFNTTEISVLQNLVRSVCLALSNPEQFKSNKIRTGASSSSRNAGAPKLEQARYLLSAPVKVDLREQVASVYLGRQGASPKVQFLVRGHWKNQAHGPGASLRRPQWIDPYWKGPEESRILLRPHEL